MKSENKSFGCIIGTWRYAYGGEDYVQLTFSEESAEGTVRCEDYDDGDWQTAVSSYTFCKGILKMPELTDRKLKVINLSASEMVLQDWPHRGKCVFLRQTDDITDKQMI